MQPIQAVLPLLDTPKRIFITTHHKPDGDAMGSMLALYHYLTKRGHSCTPVSPSEVPDFLRWLPGMESVIDFETTPDAALTALHECDLIFCLDFNALGRIKAMEPALQAANQPKLLIDHHMYPQPVFQYGMSEPDKSSTCEMVYDFILLSDGAALLDSTIATCLYTGAMTDTGSFRFSAATASVHRMVAHLMEAGLHHTRIHDEVYDAWSESRMRFLGYVLIEKMQLFPEYHAGLITLSKKDLQLFKVSTGDTEGIVNYPLSVRGIRFATLITERSDEVRLSFRSKGDFDVNLFARTHFGGGGHFNASGGRSGTSFSETVARFTALLPEFHPL